MLFESPEYGNIIRVKGFVIDSGSSYQINAIKGEIIVSQISIGEGVVIIIGTKLNEEKITDFMRERGNC